MEQDVLSKAIRHLKKSDTVMARLINNYPPLDIAARRSNHYHTMVRTIINQQLSIKAGATILQRLITLQGGRVLNAGKVAPLKDRAILKCGISNNKLRYIRAITNAVVDGELNFKRLEKQDDETVISELTHYPGIGQWSAEIFLISSLSRPDVLPIGDLVLRKSMQKHYPLDSDSPLQDYLEVAQSWRPYRTVASRYLWSAVLA